MIHHPGFLHKAPTQKPLDVAPAPTLANWVRALLENPVRPAQSLSRQLAPPILRGLGELFESLAQQEWSLYGLEVPDEAVRVLLYRLLLELLFNVSKHAGTSRARLWAEPCDGCIRIVVEDEGGRVRRPLPVEARASRARAVSRAGAP